MGNSSSSGGSSTVSVADLLQLIAQEEAESRAQAPVHDGPAPGESELSGELSALGVEMGEASVAGEACRVLVCARQRERVWSSRKLSSLFSVDVQTWHQEGNERREVVRGCDRGTRRESGYCKQFLCTQQREPRQLLLESSERDSSGCCWGGKFSIWCRFRNHRQQQRQFSPTRGHTPV